MYTLGGVPVINSSLTKSWGLSPASATVRVPGVPGLSAGAEIILSIGSFVFNAVVAEDPTTSQDGTFTEVRMVDARIKLMWDWVRCYFNREIVLEDDPTKPGIQRVKRYEHMYPRDWVKQKTTRTDAPLMAGEIITKMLAADTVLNPWTTIYHPDMNTKPVYDIDCSRGKKLGTALQEISEELGLLFTLDGLNTLRWARKGEGTLPDFPVVSTNRRIGDALSHNDTRVMIIGDQNRIQDNNVQLEADWNAKYEGFWLEPLWLTEVNTVFGPYTDDVAGEAQKAAKARTVTMRDYVTKKDATYADNGLWGEVLRMEIPVWLYLRDIVWKAFRVPRTYSLNGVVWHDLEMTDKGLLSAVEVDPQTGNVTLKSPRETYPDTKAVCAVKGQPINLLDPRAIELITTDAMDKARDAWQPVAEFNFDIKNKVILFEHAQFVPGSGKDGLFIFPNKDVTDIKAGDPLKNLAVPNAAVKLTAASVKAAIVFEADVLFKEYGAGARRGPKYIRGLCQHAIYNNGVFAEEVKYADGKSAADKMDTIGAALGAQQGIYKLGGYNRPGSAGTALTGSVDRITVSINWSGGLEEAVEFTKERTEPRAENERLLERRARTRDLYPGQKGNAEDVARLTTIYTASKELKRSSRPIYSHANDISQHAVGAVDCAPSTVKLKDSTPAGRPIFVDALGVASNIGNIFKGINIMDGAQGSQCSVATQGMVPVRVKGPVGIGDRIGVNLGEDDAIPNGGRSIGVANASYTGTDFAVLPVRLVANLAMPEPWTVNFSGGTTPKATVYASTINGIFPTNLGDPISMGTAGKRYIVLSVKTDGFQVTSCTLEAATTPAAPPPCLKGAAPTDFNIPIWAIDAAGRQYQVFKKPLVAVQALCQQTERGIAPIGKSPFDNWWTWAVGETVIPDAQRLVG